MKISQIIYSIFIYLILEFVFVVLLNVIVGESNVGNLPGWGVVVFWIFTLTLWYVPYKYFTLQNKKDKA